MLASPTQTLCLPGEIAELEQRLLPMSKARPVSPASINAAHAANWPRLAGARGSLRHGLALKQASGEPAGPKPAPPWFRRRLGLRPQGKVGPEFMAAALAEYMAAQNDGV